MIRLVLAAALLAPLIAPAQTTGPYCEPQVPGSTYRIRAGNLAVLHDVHVMVAGFPAPVYWISPQEIGYQVPWEVPVSDQPQDVVLTWGNPDGETVLRIGAIVSEYPRAWRPFAAHGDWHGPVTEEDPAVPGEWVHLFLTGLGPVRPFVPTGHPAPLGTLSRALSTCQWRFGATPAEVYFAGLAPGLVGLYQVTLRVPNASTGKVYCGTLVGELPVISGASSPARHAGGLAGGR